MTELENDIVIPDLDLCAHEPVHTIGDIQPHGFLFGMSEPDFIVRHVSANVSALLGIPVETVLGQSLEAVLGAPQFEMFQSQTPRDTDLAGDPLRMRLGGGALDVQCVTHRHDGVLIAEFELLNGVHHFEPLNLNGHIRLPLARMELASSLLELSQFAAGEVRRLSGFDRVMVYRFDEEWNGEVLAESVGSSPISYLGLRFPANDIPVQARRLLLLNRMRTIVDAAASPVPIVSEIGPHPERPLDLTYSLLRSPAPFQVEYLRNMGVQSALTVSIIAGGRLWGLVACHHSSPRHVDYATRSICELIGQMLGAKVALRIDNAALQARLASRNLLNNYTAALDASRSSFYADYFHGDRLLRLFDADGMALRIDGVVSLRGHVVEADALKPAIEKLQEISSRGIASSSMLRELDAGAESFASQVSGALYLGLTEESGDYLLLLRQELPETVSWAGNPDKIVHTDQHGRMHPRASFQAWKEIVRGRSRPWNELQLESARSLREQLLRLKESLSVFKLRQARKIELAESERRFRFLADTMPHLIWTAKPDGTLDYYNERWLNYTGRPLEYWASAIHPDDLPNSLERWTKTLATGCDYEVEYRIRRASDGVYRWHLGRAFPLRNDKGEVIQWVGTCTDIEDQKQANNELERGVAERTAQLNASREQLQMVLDGATNVSIVAANTDGLITLFNRGAEKMLEYTSDEMVGKRTPEAFHLESEVIARGLQLTEETGKPIHGVDVFVEKARNGQHEEREWTYVRKDGGLLTVNLVVTGLHDAGGNIIGFLGVAMDVSAHKQAVAAARASDQHFRLIVETVADYALIMLDTDGHVVSWNIGAERIKGYKAAEILGRHFSCFYSPDDVARRHPQEELRIAAKHGRYTEEGWRLRKDGSRFLADVFIAPVHDDGGKLVGFAKVIHDITERKATEERFQLVVEAAPSAMIMVDAEGLIALVNTQTEKLFGFERGEMLGRPIEMLLPARFRQKHGGLLSAFFASPVTRSMGAGRDLFALRKDGGETPVEIGLNPIATSQGQFVLASIIDITDRKRIERSLREQALILDMANDTIFIRDSEDRITYWNQGAQRLYGWTSEEAIGHITHELLRTRFPKSLDEIRSQLFAQGGWHGELVHTRRDGSLVTVASSWTLQRDAVTESVSVLEINFDVTSRKQTEERLNSFAARLGLATQVLRAGIWDWNINTKAVLWDETMREIYGLAKDSEVTYQTWAHAVLPEDLTQAEAALQNVLTSKSEVSAEFRITLPDGSLRYIQAAHGVILDDSGQVVRLIGVNIDATERRFNERQAAQRSTQLEEANQQLKVVIRRLGLATDALQAGIWDWDVRTDTIVWDERMYRIYGIPDGTPVDYNAWADAVVTEDLPVAEAVLQTVIASKSQGSAQFRIKLPDGSLRYIQAAEGAIVDDAGEVIRVIGINIDTTDRKFNEDLERQVAERTSQLRAANKELEEFAYVASHDLKAPLRVIDNASKWLEEDLQEHLTGEARENLSLLRGRVRRMEKLLDDLLEYARIGRATDTRFIETIHGDELMSDVLALLAPADITLRVGPGFSEIEVCRMPLQQIFMNLIGNAIKHHDKKTGSIDVTVEDGGDYYAFAVTDDGPGIAAQFHDQIFTMFQTLRPRDQVEGSGMGLAMVRKNVEVFGGVVRLTSAEGQGSTFRFTWPKHQRLNSGGA